MDTRTEDSSPYWLNPDNLVILIDELREAGYKIGVSQYIAAQNLILTLTVQSEIVVSPDQLKTLLGPIFCSSPTEQEDFQQYFNRWIKLIGGANSTIEEVQAVKKVDVKAKALSHELKKIQKRFRQFQKILIGIGLVLVGILLPIALRQLQNPAQISTPLSPSPSSSAVSPSSPPTLSPASQPSPKPSPSPSLEPEKSKAPGVKWEEIAGYFSAAFLISYVILLTGKIWWRRRAQLFLQRLRIVD